MQLAHVQNGQSVTLNCAIDNGAGEKKVALHQIYYNVGWYSVSAALGNNTFLYTTTVEGNYYNLAKLQSAAQSAVPSLTLTLNAATGYVAVLNTNIKYTVNCSACRPGVYPD